MSLNSSHKITPDHLSRRACLYIRQSSLHQVQHNRESQLRQRQLYDRAIGLGWSEDQIDIIDEDQGKSGATSAQRTGFQDLRARVGAGEVGILLCLEVSRLCRDNAEWHQLLRMAAIANTLILDEYGIYDAEDSNDWLLLGIKGQLSEFELRGIRARMIGGQRSKARRGALKIPLPTGLVYTETDEVVKDPDRSIQEAIALVFSTFRRLGSAMQVTKWFIKQEIQLPVRGCGQASAAIYWGLPTHSHIRRILHNPRYAGCYAYGRNATKTHPDGTSTVKVLPMDQWLVCLPEAHEGYIDWEEYLQNQETLRRNAASFLRGAARTPSPRKGVALLQSRILCGLCGHRMQVTYGDSGGTIWYYLCREEVVRRGKRTCQSMRGDVLDTAVGHFIVAAVNRENLALSLIIREQLRTDFEAGDRQRQNRIKDLLHQEDQARRRYMEVDPSNRLVAATLEGKWEDSLRAYHDAVQEREKYVQQQQCIPDAELDARILELANDFGTVWQAEQTTNEDRKRLLGLLIEDITLLRNGYQVTVQLRLRGGRTHELPPVDLPLPRATVVRRDATPEVLTELETLLEAGYPDGVAAQELNQRGHRDSRGDEFTRRCIQNLRNRYNMKNGIWRQREQLRKQGYKLGRELADELCISYATLQNRARYDPRIKIHRIHVAKQTFAMYKFVPESSQTITSDT